MRSYTKHHQGLRGFTGQTHCELKLEPEITINYKNTSCYPREEHSFVATYDKNKKMFIVDWSDQWENRQMLWKYDKIKPYLNTMQQHDLLEHSISKKLNIND